MQIAQAYDCLSNKDKRATYDRYGNEPPEDHYKHYQQYYSQDINPEVLFLFLYKYFRYIFLIKFYNFLL